MRLVSILSGLCLSIGATAPLAQEANVAFGGLVHDARQPVEVTADNLSVSQADGSAVFSGNVRVAQGELKLSAGEVRVEYSEDGDRGTIEKLIASDGVTFVTATEAAEAENAVYTLSTSLVVLTGDVVLTQGPNALAGDRLVINLEDGTGNMEGRVRTVFQTGDGN